jgi:hypothetical protein
MAMHGALQEAEIGGSGFEATSRKVSKTLFQKQAGCGGTHLWLYLLRRLR